MPRRTTGRGSSAELGSRPAAVPIAEDRPRGAPRGGRPASGSRLVRARENASAGSSRPYLTTFPKGITMRTNLRRAVTLLVAAAAVGLGAATVASAPAAAETVCQGGTNWDGVLKVCR